jgi:hypothetical protein
MGRGSGPVILARRNGKMSRALRSVLLLVSILCMVRAGQAAPPLPKEDASAAISALTGGDGAALASNLRTILLAHLPDPLFEDAKKWGLQKKGPLGRTHNDGRWWKVRVTGRNLRDSLLLDVRDVQKPAPGKTTFTVYLMFDATVLLDRQTWRLGARLYSGSTRARVRLRLTMNCEAETRLEKNGGWMPDAVFRMRVLKSDFRYDNLVVEHTAGVSGEAAKLLGDAMIGTVRQVRPSLERKLIEKANAAIVKAGDTKEVRVSLLDMMSGKKTGAIPKK